MRISLASSLVTRLHEHPQDDPSPPIRGGSTHEDVPTPRAPVPAAGDDVKAKLPATSPPTPPAVPPPAAPASSCQSDACPALPTYVPARELSCPPPSGLPHSTAPPAVTHA